MGPPRDHWAQPSARLGRGELFTLLLAMLALAAIMVPVFVRTYHTSLTFKCRQRLSQIYRAVYSYAQSNDGFPPCQAVDPSGPDGADWRAQLRERLVDGGWEAADDWWTCPSGGAYVGNVHVFGPPHRRLDEFLLSREIGLVADGAAESDATGVGEFDAVDWRHRDHANILFLDGHVEWVAQEKPKSFRRHWNAPQ